MSNIRDWMKQAVAVWYGTASGTPSSDGAGSISVSNVPAGFKWFAIGGAGVLPGTNNPRINSISITDGDTHYSSSNSATGVVQRVVSNGTVGASPGTITLSYNLSLDGGSSVVDLVVIAVKAQP